MSYCKWYHIYSEETEQGELYIQEYIKALKSAKINYKRVK